MGEPAMKKKNYTLSVRNPFAVSLRKLRLQIIKNKKLPFIRKTKHKKPMFTD
tara:strand:- start:61 stop:216 length:156 start_codon:yes stop_codon:yes gene_type:complete